MLRNTIQFEVMNTDVLSFLARNDWNAYTFLYLYIEKTLRDSGIWDLFATFLDQQTKKNFDEMKDGFATFCKSYTPIRTTVEANRIFAKVLNPLACRYHKAGTIAGRMSPVNITFNLLSYNRGNWRDVNKPKDVARQDYGKSNPQPSTMYFAAKAMDEVKKFNKQFNDGHSEVLGKQVSFQKLPRLLKTLLLLLLPSTSLWHIPITIRLKLMPSSSICVCLRKMRQYARMSC